MLIRCIIKELILFQYQSFDFTINNKNLKWNISSVQRAIVPNTSHPSACAVIIQPNITANVAAIRRITRKGLLRLDLDIISEDKTTGSTSSNSEQDVIGDYFKYSCFMNHDRFKSSAQHLISRRLHKKLRGFEHRAVS